MFIEEDFNYLKRKWEKETAHLSSITEILNNKYYLQIIDMGDSVVPLIIQDLKNTNNHWFQALYELTGENPVPENHAGDIEMMKKDWIDWFNLKVENMENIINEIIKEQDIKIIDGMDLSVWPLYVLEHVLIKNNIFHFHRNIGLLKHKRGICILNRINKETIIFLYDKKAMEYYDYQSNVVLTYEEKDCYLFEPAIKMIYNMFQNE